VIVIEKRNGWRVVVAKLRKDAHDGSVTGGYLATVEKGASNLVATFRLEHDSSPATYRGQWKGQNRWYATQVQGDKIDEDRANDSRKDTLRALAEAVLRACMQVEVEREHEAQRVAKEAAERAAEEAAARAAVEALRTRFGVDGRENAWTELKRLTATAKSWQNAADHLADLLSLADPKRFEHWSIVQDFSLPTPQQGEEGTVR
jgi:hypothetical protein